MFKVSGYLINKLLKRPRGLFNSLSNIQKIQVFTAL
jgi:hypothetical protein